MTTEKGGRKHTAWSDHLASGSIVKAPQLGAGPIGATRGRRISSPRSSMVTPRLRAQRT
jgi:hypothetical protein